MSEVVQVTVAEEQKNERIDKFVAGINNDGHVHKYNNGLKMTLLQLMEKL